jgi:ParB family chromosome partitioning protein
MLSPAFRLGTDDARPSLATFSSQEIACEGWWIETRTRRDDNEMFGFARLHSVSREPTPEEQAELDALIVKRDAASDALNAYYDTDGEPDEDEQERLEDAAKRRE